jgi:hypothetical protein
MLFTRLKLCLLQMSKNLVTCLGLCNLIPSLYHDLPDLISALELQIVTLDNSYRRFGKL